MGFCQSIEILGHANGSFSPPTWLTEGRRLIPYPSFDLSIVALTMSRPSSPSWLNRDSQETPYHCSIVTGLSCQYSRSNSPNMLLIRTAASANYHQAGQQLAQLSIALS